MTKQELIKVLLIVSGTYQSWQSNELTLETWQAILNDCTYQHTQKALFNYIKEGHAFAPTPGQIYQAICQIRKDERRLSSLKELPAPEEISEEKKQENLAILKKLSEDIARKKAMRQ
jgi:hypothetical protein